MIKVIEKLNRMGRDSKKIFNIIQKNGPLTKAQILDITKLKLTTLNRIMNPFIRDKLIVESSIGESTGGRKPIFYDVNVRDYAFVGIDISRIYTQVVFMDLKLNLIFKERFNMDRSHSPKNTVAKITEICERAEKIPELKNKEIIAAGLGTVGPFDMKRGLMKNTVNFRSEGWDGAPIRDMLEKTLKLTVYMDNGANAAVTAEYEFGSGKGLKNIAYFNFGMGIRTAVISNGNIIRTINDAEDAFAHMVINVHGEKCSCGNYGCVECYSSIKAITEKFKQKIITGEKTKIQKQLQDINYIDISLAAEEGDSLANGIIREAAEVFAAGLANFINLLNPELVVLSGPLIMASQLFYLCSVDMTRKKCYLSKQNNIFFNRGGYFKENAISAGAVAIAIEHLLKS